MRADDQRNKGSELGNYPTLGGHDSLAHSQRVVSEAGATKPRTTDEATRITRIVLIAVLLVLVGGLGLVVVFGPSEDDSARNAVDELGATQVSIRGADEVDTTVAPTTEAPQPDTTEAAPEAPVETAPPQTAAPQANTPAPPPSVTPTAPRPADLEVFYASDGEGRLPVREGQTVQLSLRNTGGSEGNWALNATGPVRVNGASGTNGTVAPGAIIIVSVTVENGAEPGEQRITFDVAGQPSVIIDVIVL